MSTRTDAQLSQDILDNFPNNTSRFITPTKLRTVSDNFNDSKQNKILTGYSIGTATPIVDTDTILEAFGKLQAYAAAGPYEAMTFSALQIRIAASSLNPGELILITDTKTTHIVPNDTITNLAAAIAMSTTVSVEPIVVRASSANTLEKIAFSPSNPNDIIEYDVTNILCEDGTTPRNGWITRRIDTTNNLDTPHDFRACYFLRKAINSGTHAAWAAATSRNSSYSFTNGDTVYVLSGSVSYPNNIVHWDNTSVLSDGDVVYVISGSATYSGGPYTTGQTFTITTANGLSFAGTAVVVPVVQYEVGSSFTIATLFGLSFIGAGAATKAYTEDSIVYQAGVGLFKSLRPTAGTGSFADTDWVKLIPLANSVYWLTSASTNVAGSTITGSTSSYFKTFGSGTYKNVTLKPRSDGTLHNSVILNNGTCKNVFLGPDCYDTTIDGNGINGVVLDGNNHGNIIDRTTSNFRLGPNISNNTFGASTTNFFLGKDATGNAFGEGCNSVTIRGTFNSNKLGKSSQWFVCGQDCESNSWGQSTADVTVGDNCYSNKSGNGVNNGEFDFGSYRNLLSASVNNFHILNESTDNIILASSTNISLDQCTDVWLRTPGQTYANLNFSFVAKKAFLVSMSGVNIISAKSSSTVFYNYRVGVPSNTVASSFDTALDIWTTMFSTAGLPSFYNLRTGATVALPVGAGTVTSVSVTTANGVSGSVATATTTPAITLTLGAITPTSVNGTTSTEIGYLSGATSSIQNQINNINAGLSWKNAVRAATTANITLSAAQTIDGVSVVAGDRVLVKNQSTGSENGIYLCASGSWTRVTDADTGAEMLQATVSIEEGTVNGDTIYTCTTDAPITIGSTSLVFAKTSATTYTASTGLSLSGNAFSIDSTVATLTGAQALTNKTYNGNTWTAGTGVLTIAAAKTLTVSNSITLAGTDSTVMTFPSTTATIARTDAGQTFTGTNAFAAITATNVTNSALTATRIPYAGTGGLMSDSANFTWDNTNAIVTCLKFGTSASSTIGLYTNNTARLSILGTGEIGIGSTSIFSGRQLSITASTPNIDLRITGYGGTNPQFIYGGSVSYTNTNTMLQLEPWGSNGGPIFTAFSAAHTTPGFGIMSVSAFNTARTSQPAILFSAAKSNATNTIQALASTDWLFAIQNASVNGFTTGTTYLSMFGNGDTHFYGTTEATNATTAGMVIDSGVGIAKKLFVTGAVSLASTLAVTGIFSCTDTTDASSATAGGSTFAGGVGINKKLFVTGNTALAGTLVVSGATTTGSGYLITASAGTQVYVSAQGAGGGSNTLGNDLLVTAGGGTGNTIAAAVIIQTPTPLGSGSSLQLNSTRVSIDNSAVTLSTVDLKLSTVGKGIYIKEGTNAMMGTGTLVGGTATISTTKVTASSRIFVTDTGGGVVGNIGALYISAVSAGTSFAVTSNNPIDTSTFNWIIIEPA